VLIKEKYKFKKNEENKIMKDLINKISLKQKIALSIMFLHLVFVLIAFRHDNIILNGDFCTFQERSGQVEQPLPWLGISDTYFFFFAHLTPYEWNLMDIDGTGGPCTFITVNSSLPQSLVFVLVSSAVYYLIGLFIGYLFELNNRTKIKKE